MFQISFKILKKILLISKFLYKFYNCKFENVIEKTENIKIFLLIYFRIYFFV